jgi:DNA-binding CsgD family transcriptional regulator
MILTRQEKEKKILDLYDQGKTYKQIAEIVRVSPRDINPVIKKAERERERELGISTQEGNNGGTENRQTQKKISTSTQAYRLFSEGKTPLEVAIELNIKQPEATRCCREYWKLSQMHTLNMVYEKIGDDIIHLPKIHRKIREAGMGVDQAINLIKNANNDLSALEQKYQKLKSDVDLLESRKLEEYQTLDKMQVQIDKSEKMLEWLEISRQEEEANIDKLEQEQIRVKRLVKRFKDKNIEYIRIRSTVKQQVSGILFDGKRLLHLSLSSLMESMRSDPYRYSKLIYYKEGSPARNDIGWQYTGYNHRQQPYPSFDGFYNEYESTLLKEAEKLYNKSVEEWTEQIIKEYPIKNDSTHNKLLNPDKGQQQFCYKPFNRLLLPIAISDNQAVGVRGVQCRFVRTEFD